MFDLTGDTIAAVSSAVGSSPRGIVRISGPQAVPIADRLFRDREGQSLRDSRGFRRRLGYVSIALDGPEVPAEVYVFRAPKSYTRQDLVELHTAGSAPLLSMLVEQLLHLGARQAEPGEFTARAFLAGAMDLSQVEGVAAMVQAGSDAELQAAQQLLHGTLSEKARAIQDRLADLMARVEADIDFADEPMDFVTPPELTRCLNELTSEIDGLIHSSISAERFHTLPRVLLIGPPNSGKSTLLNRLTGLDRAICSPLPGTTRDVLTAPFQMQHGEAILIDVAGMRAESAQPGDEVAAQADEAARRAVSLADLICFVIDLSVESVALHFELLDELPTVPVLVVANKVDLLSPDRIESRRDAIVAWRRLRRLPQQRNGNGQSAPSQTGQYASGRVASDVHVVSALTGAGCDALREAVESSLHCETIDRSGALVVLNARHRQALNDAAAALERATRIAAQIDQTIDRADILALELREASDHLAAITGAVATEELLARIFSQFCIGK